MGSDYHPTYGPLIVSAIIFCAALIAGLRRMGRKFAHSLQTRLIPAEGHQWIDPKRIDALALSLINAGFADAGIYNTERNPDYFIRFLVNEATSAGACIYESRRRGIIFDLYSRYEDGGGITICLEDIGYTPRPSSRIVYAPGRTMEQLYQLLLDERKTAGLIAMKSDNIAALYEDNFARERVWRQNHEISRMEVARLLWAAIRRPSSKKS